ncbi:hypothetical protein J7M02_07760 [Candidatus Aerophobetes bacterium]|nr:hypothetical protein [Candidatus Aerophobetes bacterium]
MICPVCKILIEEECWRCGWKKGNCPYCGYPIVINGRCVACGKQVLLLPASK